MKTSPVGPGDLRGVFACPSWSVETTPGGQGGARLDARASQATILRAARGGVTRFLCDPRAVTRAPALGWPGAAGTRAGDVPELPLAELCRFLAQFPREWWAVPVVPAPDDAHAALLARTFFPCVAVGLEAAEAPAAAARRLRSFAQAARKRLVVRLRQGAPGHAVDVSPELTYELRRLVGDGTCVAIACSATRADGSVDPALVEGVGAERLVGELTPASAAAELGAGAVVGVAAAWVGLAPRTARALHAASTSGQIARAARLAARLTPPG